MEYLELARVSHVHPLHVNLVLWPASVLEFAAMPKRCTSRFERGARKCGWQRIAGLDEGRRGAMFVPVVAAEAIRDPKRRIAGLDDSTKFPAYLRVPLALRSRERAPAR